MTKSWQEMDLLLSETVSASDTTSTATLRLWRGELVRASARVSYAISVLSLDIEILNRSLTSSSDDVLKALVEDLPGILASGWVGSGWSISPNALMPADPGFELDIDMGLLDVHSEMVGSDLSDPNVIGELLVRIKQELQNLLHTKDLLEDRIRQIQVAVRKQYSTGVASVDDWLH